MQNLENGESYQSYPPINYQIEKEKRLKSITH